MFCIRKEQMAGFEKTAEEACRQRLQERMMRAYPQEAGRLGPEAVARRIDAGTAEAEAHGIADRENIERYLHLMFLFCTDSLAGSPEISWAGNILAWDDADEWMRLSALEKKARRELLRSAG